MIAAIDWVVQHKNDNGMHIRVLNLSYGTQSTQDYRADLLTYAVKQAWRNGILVVAAGGNDGIQTTQLSDPAYDPLVLAVGADDPNGTLGSLDDTIPAFATHGNAQRRVDVTAPATHVVSLKVPGSFVDQNYGATASVGTRFIRGSGTSQAAAVVSGVAALLFQRFPNATPDQIKSILMSTANQVSTQNILWGGNGIVAADQAVLLPLPLVSNTHPLGAGNGTLDATRGGDVLSINTHALLGQIDIFAQHLDLSSEYPASTGGVAWSGGTFNAQTWSGPGWQNGRWANIAWPASSWAGTAWNDPLTRRRRLGRQPLVGQPLVGQRLVGQPLVRQPLVRQPLVRRQLVVTRLRLRRPRADS